MPESLTLKVFLLGLVSLMHVRIAFLAGFVTHYLTQRESLPLESIAQETSALRREIREARAAVLELQLGQEGCEWQVWSQRWVIRVSLLVDVLLVVWIFWLSRPKTPAPRPQILADTGGSSSDTDSPGVPALQKNPLAVTGKGATIRGRPARPSDFKGGK